MSTPHRFTLTRDGIEYTVLTHVVTEGTVTRPALDRVIVVCNGDWDKRVTHEDISGNQLRIKLPASHAQAILQMAREITGVAAHEEATKKVERDRLLRVAGPRPGEYNSRYAKLFPPTYDRVR